MIHSQPSWPASATTPFTSNHRLHGHAVQFYLTEEFFLSVLCDFTRSALRADDGIVVVATDAHHRALAQRLAGFGIDVPELQRQGHYAGLDADEALSHFMVDGKPDLSHFQQMIGGAIAKVRAASPAEEPHVTVFGELLALLWARRDLAAMLEVEQFWRTLARRFSFSYLSCYSIHHFAAPGTEDIFLRLCARHSTVIPPDAYPTADAEKRILHATARAYSNPSVLLATEISGLDPDADLRLNAWRDPEDEIEGSDFS